MKTELKEKWIKALRSGRYKQGMGTMRSKIGNYKFEYCCLGVLCNIVNRRKWTQRGGVTFHQYEFQEESETAVIPCNLRKHIGLENKEERSLIDMNDRSNKSFKEIADYIEENL